MGIIIDGKFTSNYLKEWVKNEIDFHNAVPTLAVIIVGNNPASRVYVNNKKKACEEVGIRCLEIKLSATISEDELLDIIYELNVDKKIDAILCQLPLPKHIDERAIIEAINPKKDVDGFSIDSVGSLWVGDYNFVPCTPAGIIELLHHYDIPIEGKHCVIVGRSNIVGKPLAALLLEENATVTICHSKTKDLASFTKNADIVIAAVGRPKFITADMIKEGATVIDVGINRLDDGKLCGDVDFDNVKDKAGAITPVPGGVGPMTITMLLTNVLRAYLSQFKPKERMEDYI